MGTANTIRIANDNIPEPQLRDNISAYRPRAASSSQAPTQQITDSLSVERGPLKKERTRSLNLTLTCLIVAALFGIAVLPSSLGTGPKVLTSLTLFWAGLWSSYVSADHGYWRLSEISVIAALTGLMSTIVTTANYFGFGLTLADGLMLMSLLPIAIAYVLKSRICILASICATLIWAALSFFGLAETSNFMMLYPAILAGQLFTATKIRSGMAIMLAVITGYYWFFNFVLTHYMADNLPLTFAAAALFALGAAHHRSGKAAEDKRQTGSSIHIYTGWVAAIAGAIGFQYFWLTPDAVQNSTATLSVTGLNYWKAAIICALGVVFCSAIIRYKHSQISLMGIFLLTAASAIIPLMLWFPGWPQNIASAIHGVTPIPTIGIFIGAAITAAALGMTLNGVRRHSLLMMGLGLAALFAEAYLLMTPEFITIDNVIIFGAGFLAALAIGGIIAGSSLAHQAPAPRLKHS